MEIIESIIKSLTQSTNNGSICWRLSNSIFNTDTCKKFETESLDGLTKFTIEIHTDIKFVHNPKDTNLNIFNSNLVDGVKYLNAINVPVIKDLSIVVFNKYALPLIPKKNDEKAFEGILNSLSNKQQIRDDKIESILSDKGKGFLNRLFGE